LQRWVTFLVEVSSRSSLQYFSTVYLAKEAQLVCKSVFSYLNVSFEGSHLHTAIPEKKASLTKTECYICI